MPKKILGKVTAYQTAILYGLCILDSNFLYWPLLCGGVSTKHCLFQFSSFDVMVVLLYCDILWLFPIQFWMGNVGHILKKNHISMIDLS